MKLSIELYEWDIYFCIGKDNYEAKIKEFKQDYLLTTGWDGIHTYFTENFRFNSIIGLDIDSLKGYPDYKSRIEKTLIHEITHAMQYIKEMLNLNCKENEAIIIEYLYSNFMPYLRERI